jgi:hypothetical protein
MEAVRWTLVERFALAADRSAAEEDWRAYSLALDKLWDAFLTLEPMRPPVVERDDGDPRARVIGILDGPASRGSAAVVDAAES